MEDARNICVSGAVILRAPSTYAVVFIGLLSLGCGRNSVTALSAPDVGTEVIVRDGSVLPDDASTYPDATTGPRDADPGPIDTGPADTGPPPPLDSGPGPFDAGSPRPDADIPDAGTVNDAGTPADIGTTNDAGTIIDASRPDTGTPPPDAGTNIDAGLPTDAGGPTDAGSPTDAGPGCTSNAACGGGTPICNTSSGICVECLNNNQCGFRESCDTARGFVCRRTCTNNCRGGQTCDPAAGFCYDCISNSDCGSDEFCNPAVRECVQCISNADCASTPGLPLCSGDGECRGCLSDSDCPMGETCHAELGGFCAAPQGRAQCEPCDSDSQCGGASDLCIGYFIGTYVDRSCSRDCSNSPCPRGFGCITVRGNARVCRPRYDMNQPTCTAHRNLGLACTVDPNDLDPGCGVENFQDARCLPTASGTTVGQCTFWCEDNNDCPVGANCTPISGQLSVCL